MNLARYDIRPARPRDVPAIVAMVHELAQYERAPDQCQLTDAQLAAALFGDSPALFGHVAQATATSSPATEAGLVGFALWFLNFSTWRGVHGIYIEDLYVKPQARGHGLGRALLAELAGVCRDRGYARLEWWVLSWNPARDFYHRIGASAMEEWVPYRLDGEALRRLADPEEPIPARPLATQPLPAEPIAGEHDTAGVRVEPS